MTSVRITKVGKVLIGNRPFGHIHAVREECPEQTLCGESTEGWFFYYNGDRISVSCKKCWNVLRDLDLVTAGASEEV